MDRKNIPSDAIVVKRLRPITDIKRVYSGHKGCACGCQGIYYPDSEYENGKYGVKAISKRDLTMFKRVQNLFQKALAEGKVYTWEKTIREFVCLDMPWNRTYTIYYTD